MKKLAIPILCLSAISFASFCQDVESNAPPPSPAALFHIKDVIGPRALRKTTSAMREKAALRQKMFQKWNLKSTPTPGGQPNYFGPEPNYANSPFPTIFTTKGKVKKTRVAD